MDSQTPPSPPRAVQPQDETIALVEREWRRTARRAGVLTERTREGERVRAARLEDGTMRRAEGIVRRNEARELVIQTPTGEQTPGPRDANIDRGRVRQPPLCFVMLNCSGYAGRVGDLEASPAPKPGRFSCTRVCIGPVRMS